MGNQGVPPQSNGIAFSTNFTLFPFSFVQSRAKGGRRVYMGMRMLVQHCRVRNRLTPACFCRMPVVFLALVPVELIGVWCPILFRRSCNMMTHTMKMSGLVMSNNVPPLIFAFMLVIIVMFLNPFITHLVRTAYVAVVGETEMVNRKQQRNQQPKEKAYRGRFAVISPRHSNLRLRTTVIGVPQSPHCLRTEGPLYGVRSYQ